MQDRDAELAGGVDVGVEGDRVFEGQGGRGERVVGWEEENAAEIASYSREMGKLAHLEDQGARRVGKETGSIRVPP